MLRRQYHIQLLWIVGIIFPYAFMSGYDALRRRRSYRDSVDYDDYQKQRSSSRTVQQNRLLRPFKNFMQYQQNHKTTIITTIHNGVSKIQEEQVNTYTMTPTATIPTNIKVGASPSVPTPMTTIMTKKSKEAESPTAIARKKSVTKKEHKGSDNPYPGSESKTNKSVKMTSQTIVGKGHEMSSMKRGKGKREDNVFDRSITPTVTPVISMSRQPTISSDTPQQQATIMPSIEVEPETEFPVVANVTFAPFVSAAPMPSLVNVTFAPYPILLNASSSPSVTPKKSVPDANNTSAPTPAVPSVKTQSIPTPVERISQPFLSRITATPNLIHSPTKSQQSPDFNASSTPTIQQEKLSEAQILLPLYYIAFSAPLIEREPTMNEYMAIVNITNLYFEEIFATIYTTEALLFLHCNTSLESVQYQSNVPDPNYNINMTLNTSVVFDSTNTTNLTYPSGVEMLEIMKKSISVTYVVNHLWHVPETPFTVTQNAFLNPLENNITANSNQLKVVDSSEHNNTTKEDLKGRFILPGSQIPSRIFCPNDCNSTTR